MNGERTTIVLADDHPVLRRGLRDIINERPCFQVVGEADSGDAVIDLIIEKTPDIAVLDIEMPGMSGIEAAGKLKGMVPDTSLIILTMHREPHFFFHAIDAGVDGYVLKENAIRDIYDSLDRVKKGEFYITAEMRDLLLEHRMKKRRLRSEYRGIDTITNAERTVLRHIAKGLMTKEIADLLSVSSRTVEHHRSSICRKLELKGNNALLLFALKHQTEF